MMSPEKILEANDAAWKAIHARWPAAAAVRNVEARYLTSLERAEHLLYMIEEIPKMLALGKREKVMRWLGFMQGALWYEGVQSINELKEINRPEDGSAE